MENGNNIPKKDREMADRIGRWLSEGKSLSDFPDPEIRFLKQELDHTIVSETSEPAPGKDRVWQQISQQTSPGATVTPLFSTPVKRALAIAASILLATLLSLFVYTQMGQPRLLAESGDTLMELTLDDGSNATLRPNSSLYLVSLDEDEHLYKMDGEIFFEVTANPERTFSVEAGDGVAHVLGTSFNIRTWSGQTELFLESGSVRFELSDGSDFVTLSPGKRSTITGSSISEPEDVSTDLITSWKRNELVFRDRPAGSIFSELEHHFDIEIMAPDIITRERLGGTISLDDRNESLRDLGLVLGGEFVEQDNETYRFELTDQ